jgi:hypothetical protein
MHNFVIQAMAAVWAAYHKYAEQENWKPADGNTQSWLYDAACLLDILAHDERLLAIFDDYYAHSQKLPWNRRNDYPAEQEPSYVAVERLFAIWSEMAVDEEPPPEVATLIRNRELGTDDSISFMAFCNAWEKAKRTLQTEENNGKTV